MAMYEYKVVQGDELTPLSDALSALGNLGWEWCGQSTVITSEDIPWTIITMKRELVLWTVYLFAAGSDTNKAWDRQRENILNQQAFFASGHHEQALKFGDDLIMQALEVINRRTNLHDLVMRTNKRSVIQLPDDTIIVIRCIGG